MTRQSNYEASKQEVEKAMSAGKRLEMSSMPVQ